MSEGARVIRGMERNDLLRAVVAALERIAGALEAANEREARSDAAFQTLGAALVPGKLLGEDGQVIAEISPGAELAGSFQERLIAEQRQRREARE